MLARLASTVCVMLVLAACSSVPELTFVADDGGTTPVVNPECLNGGKGSPEICDDGIDNDCDGKVDCQDSDCTPAYSCQDAPAEWTVVAFAASSRPNCPANATPTDLAVSSGDGSATCSCTCSPTGGSCKSGSFSLTLSTEATCGVGAVNRNVPLDGDCVKLANPFSVPAGAFVKVTRPAGPTACEVKSPVNGPITNGRICQPARFGKGCGTNEVCAPKPTTGIAACVTKSGANACPTGYAQLNTAGTAADDKRTCTGCNCGPATACNGGSVSVYDGDQCKTNGNSHGATDIGTTCADATDDGFMATYVKATPPGGGCPSTPLAPAVPGPGKLTFTDARTVCCK